MTSRQRLRALAIAIATTLPAAATFAQCAMCRATLENSAEALGAGGELNQAILLLFVAPYLVASTLALALFRRHVVQALRPRFAAALASFRSR